MSAETKQYWEERYLSGNHSGDGSRGAQLEKRLELMKTHIPVKEIRAISEIGCGDFGFGKRVMELYPTASYSGMDASKTIVDRNAVLFPFAHFSHEKVQTDSDLLMFVDVLFHTEDSEGERLLKLIEGMPWKYLIMTAYERDQTEGLSRHVFIKKFDPARFGEPLVRTVVEEDGEKYLYIFKR